MHAIRLVRLAAGRTFVPDASRNMRTALLRTYDTSAPSSSWRWVLPRSHGRIDAETTSENPQDLFSRLPAIYQQQDISDTQSTMRTCGGDLGLLHASKTLATNSCVGLAAVLAVAGINPVSIATHMAPTCITSPMVLKLPTLESPLAACTPTLQAPSPVCSTFPIATSLTDGATPTPRPSSQNAPAKPDTPASPTPQPITLPTPRGRSTKSTHTHTTPTYTHADTSFLPTSLLPFVPSSLADYRDGVQQALYEHRLHATLYVSAAAWPRMGPSILAMMGPQGHGPYGRVRFSVVPLGRDYVTRANAAACMSPLQSLGELYESDLETQGLADDDDVEVVVSRRLGLDVALACLAASDRFRVRPLTECPALVVREGVAAGGEGAVRSEVYSAWYMRQGLDEHVRRNIHAGMV